MPISPPTSTSLYGKTSADDVPKVAA